MTHAPFIHIQQSPSCMLPHQNPTWTCLLPLTSHMAHPSNLPFLITRTIHGKEHKSSTFLGTLSLSSSHNMTDQVSHPRKTPSKIMVLYICKLKIANGKTLRFWTECQEITEIVNLSEFLHTSTNAQNIMLRVFSLPRILSSLNCR